MITQVVLLITLLAAYKVGSCPQSSGPIRPFRHRLRPSIEPFVCHLRLVPTHAHRVFIETSTTDDTFTGEIIDHDLVLRYNDVHVYKVPITYHKRQSITIGLDGSPWMRNVTLDPNHVVKGTSTLTLSSNEVEVFWYRTLFR